ncbi:MAG TPA: ribonuclease HIII [bacterium]|nr:ribonuclease HIII [bacterium]
MGIYSEDTVLDSFVEKAYAAILRAGFTVNPESFKKINYGVNFKANPPQGKKTITVTIYHTAKNGFSIVSSDKEVKTLLQLLISGTGTTGCDEAGKGDFFGPLVTACFVLGEKETDILKLGIKDSKKMKTEEILNLHKIICSKYPDSFSVVKIMPQRYNSFYADLSKQGKNLNDMLTWAHSKSLSSLREKRSDMKKVIVDKFSDNSSLKNRITAAAGSVPVQFMIRAESIPSVAIASIIARAEYLLSLKHLSETFLKGKYSLISGSGENSDKLLADIISEFGNEIIDNLCKKHFGNYLKILP